MNLELKKYKNDVLQQAAVLLSINCNDLPKEIFELKLKSLRFTTWDNRHDITRSVRAKARALFKSRAINKELQNKINIKIAKQNLEKEVARQEMISRMTEQDQTKYLTSYTRRKFLVDNPIADFSIFRQEKKSLKQIIYLLNKKYKI